MKVEITEVGRSPMFPSLWEDKDGDVWMFVDEDNGVVVRRKNNGDIGHRRDFTSANRQHDLRRVYGTITFE